MAFQQSCCEAHQHYRQEAGQAEPEEYIKYCFQEGEGLPTRLILYFCVRSLNKQPFLKSKIVQPTRTVFSSLTQAATMDHFA